MENVFLDELQKEYDALQEKLDDIYVDYDMQYRDQVIEDNRGKAALCPKCDNQLTIIQTDFARCDKCEVGILVRNTDKYERYVVCNHCFPNIKQAIMAVSKLDPDRLLPPEVFSIELYNTVIRPQIMEILQNYNIIDLELEGS